MAPLILFSVRKHHAGGPAQGSCRSTALALTNHDKGKKKQKPLSWPRQIYCRWSTACSLNATPQKELIVDNVGPDPGQTSFGGWGTLRSEPGSRRRTGSDFTMDTTLTALIFG